MRDLKNDYFKITVLFQNICLVGKAVGVLIAEGVKLLRAFKTNKLDFLIKKRLYKQIKQI